MEGAKAEEKYRNAIVHVEFEAPDFPLGIELVQRRHGGVMIGSLASGGNAQMLYEGILERGHRLLTINGVDARDMELGKVLSKISTARQDLERLLRTKEKKAADAAAREKEKTSKMGWHELQAYRAAKKEEEEKNKNSASSGRCNQLAICLLSNFKWMECSPNRACDDGF